MLTIGVGSAGMTPTPPPRSTRCLHPASRRPRPSPTRQQRRFHTPRRCPPSGHQAPITLTIIDFERINCRLKGRLAGTIPPQATLVAALAAVPRGKTLAADSPTSLSSAAAKTSIPLATSISKTFPARRVSSSTSSRPSKAKPLVPSNPG